MATYNARRAPNVSQYLANLNTIPSPADLAAQQQDFAPAFDDDLALFTQTQFFDFDMNEPVPNLSGDMAFNANANANANAEGNNEAVQRQASGNQNYPFPDFSFPPQRLSSQGLPPTPPNGLALPQQQQQAQPAQIQPYSQNPSIGEKRRSTVASVPSPSELEEGSRYAAEEDKRRRNTAASARFRVKKKQREQALEKTAKEMSDKVQVLEARVGQLEMENKWLKSLITEKNLKRPGSPVAAQEGAAAKTTVVDNSEPRTTQKEAERSSEASKDGVGTSA